MANEKQIEQGFINKLTDLKYIYRDDIQDRDALEANFKSKFEALNKVNLTESEFARLMEQIVSNDVFASAKMLREKNNFERDDGTPLDFMLVNIKDWCKNTFEMVNQLRVNTQNSHHRYDVILLINGVPVVQVELKALEVSPHRAMQQIIDYKNATGNGYTNTLLCFVQLFVVSNRTKTWYFANNNNQHFSFDADKRFLPVYQFADKNNKKITLLDDFTERFLAKCALGEMLSRYMVLVASEQKLIMMRPYQIYAVQEIINCINENRGNGYIWHTTGSGKTLTSFKASTLLKDNPDIEKCLFVVDRKDLDKQTRDEFNRFQENCVEENTNTKSLVRRMRSEDYADKVIVTTIQKLGIALGSSQGVNNDINQRYQEQLKLLSEKRIVFIFDECHRSQFGDNHQAIKDFFSNSQLFGFTGTPIFEDNASYTQITNQQASLKTTKDIFQKQLHAYTITNAIEDHNVLGFKIDYLEGDDNSSSDLRQKEVVKTILEKHNASTFKGKFNAIFATGSINNAIKYYNIFKKIQAKKIAEEGNYQALNIACVFSPPAEGDPDIKQLQEDLSQEKQDNKEAPNEKKAALKTIISDYNTQYGTNHKISEFDQYYKDVQQRIKDQKYPNQDLKHAQKIDIIIVVDMLLTGFDSQYLNTLYVDKKLKYHSLIQAFSRTNRVLNDSKPHGNIIDFRTQEDVTNEAITLFSGEDDKERAKEIWLVDSAPVVIEKLDDAVTELNIFMRSNDLEATPEQVANLKGDQARAQFINHFKEVQRLKTQLDQYTDLTQAENQQIEAVIPKDQLSAFKGVYLDTAHQLRAKQDKDDTIDEVQQLDFEFVLFASAIIDYDYIIKLIANYSSSVPEKQTMTKDELIQLLKSHSNLSDERDDMLDFVDKLQTGQGLDEQKIRKNYQIFKNEKHTKELAKIAKTHGLKTQDLQDFVTHITERMIFDGEQLIDLLAPLKLGWKARADKELQLMQDLAPLLKKIAQGNDISGLDAYE